MDTLCLLFAIEKSKSTTRKCATSLFSFLYWNARAIRSVCSTYIVNILKKILNLWLYSNRVICACDIFVFIFVPIIQKIYRKNTTGTVTYNGYAKTSRFTSGFNKIIMDMCCWCLQLTYHAVHCKDTVY